MQLVQRQRQLRELQRQQPDRAPATFTVSFTQAYGDVFKMRRAKEALVDVLNELLPENQGMLTFRDFNMCLQKASFQNILADFGVQPHLGTLVFRLMATRGEKLCTLDGFVDGMMEFAYNFFESGEDVDMKRLNAMFEARRSTTVTRRAKSVDATQHAAKLRGG